MIKEKFMMFIKLYGDFIVGIFKRIRIIIEKFIYVLLLKITMDSNEVYFIQEISNDGSSVPQFISGILNVKTGEKKKFFRTKRTRVGLSSLVENPTTLYCDSSIVYVGTDLGRVKQYDLKTGGEISCSRTSILEQMLENIFDENVYTENLGVRGFVSDGKNVFDYGFYGIFDTRTDEPKDKRNIISAEMIGKDLCIVPGSMGFNENVSCSKTANDYCSRFMAKAGYLINLRTGEKVLEAQVRPFDLEGGKPGNHFISSKGRVYTHHSGVPSERITISCLDETDACNKSFSIQTSLGFFEIGGTVYDVRSVGELLVIANSEKPVKEQKDVGVLYRLPKKGLGFTSVVALDDKVVVALHDMKTDVTRLFSNKESSRRALMSLDGKIKITK
jgi:hypothetical protein